VDIVGNSHQIFHVLVVLGAWFQYAALRGMVWGRAMAVGGGK
jgi:adiponectin receptor